MAVGNTGEFLEFAADAMCTWLSRDGGSYLGGRCSKCGKLDLLYCACLPVLGACTLLTPTSNKPCTCARGGARCHQHTRNILQHCRAFMNMETMVAS